MNPLFLSIVATIVVSLISLVGIIAISIKKEALSKVLLSMVGFSAGTMLGGAFLHLIPEVAAVHQDENIFIYVLIGFIAFFLLERIIHWHHCHKNGGECEVHTFTYMNLVGDGLHNFLDGLIIATSFYAGTGLGIATTLAVIAHEIPQEISDYGVLIYGGFSKGKALLFNFLSATLAILGAIFSYFLISRLDNLTDFLIMLTAGGFIYISASDLIPELHREPILKKSISSFIFFVIGIIFMYIVKIVFEA